MRTRLEGDRAPQGVRKSPDSAEQDGCYLQPQVTVGKVSQKRNRQVIGKGETSAVRAHSFYG